MASVFEKVIPILKRETRRFQTPVVEIIAKHKKDPFAILISTMLSLRTKDQTTARAFARLYALAKTPEAVLALPRKKLEKIIYPVGFYKTKAKNIQKTCLLLLKKHKGKVPDSIDELVDLPGVGRKTANLVVSLGYHKPGICVDTHVHRIANRLGAVKTKNPYETEMALRKTVDKHLWSSLNVMLVTWGQNICTPLGPRCSACAIRSLCKQRGVTKKR